MTAGADGFESDQPLTTNVRVGASAEIDSEQRHVAPPQESASLGVPEKTRDPRSSSGGEADGPTDREADGASVLARLDPRGNDVVQVIGALALVIGLLLLVKVVLTRATGVLGGGGRPSGVVEVLARYPIARGQQLLLLKVARRVILLHQTGSTMSTLSEVVDPDEVAALLARVEAGSSRESGAFRKAFSQFLGEHDGAAVEAVQPGRTFNPDHSEVIDLTRAGAGKLRRFLGGGGTGR